MTANGRISFARLAISFVTLGLSLSKPMALAMKTMDNKLAAHKTGRAKIGAITKTNHGCRPENRRRRYSLLAATAISLAEPSNVG